ncbi:neutral zinc metallopeptidase [Nonomuraea sp. K274]|uniref:Neutral zinc metallopeptidase n=1 Tax=Nonomuraea cypriaca TaxID=1187855 RepID=A0A931AN98_9ACTN|nr:neutral zinc metallopeptidase [Nonomuraea cypriaca]MBF8192017.1 neutral zinc metallopeptidase [Nonomuraea cypriaca]
MPPRQWQHQPPRRKSGMGVIGVLGIVFGSLAALVVMIVVAGALFREATSSDTSNPVAIPSYEPSERATDDDDDEPAETPSDEPSEEPSDEPSDDDAEEPDTTVKPPVQVNRSLKNNTMYKAGTLPRLNCRAGGASIFSHSQLKALILKTGKCMNQAWQPILEKQGIQFRAPKYAIASGSGRGACGDYPSPGSMVPYYCPSNSTIYASTSAMAKGNGNARGYGQIIAWHGGIISMMAHEYGHHVQNVTGLMDSWWSSTLDTSSQNTKLALSRRLELQATCFGGMWMRSVATSYPVSTSNRSRLFWFYGQVGDYPGYPRDHGKPVNNNRWFRQGWEKNKAYQCNTWMASSANTS